MFGPILAIFGHGRPYFFIDARDGTVGGRVRPDVARIDEKKLKMSIRSQKLSIRS